MNSELSKLSCWFQVNMLLLNISGVAIGCAGCAMHKGPRRSGAPGGQGPRRLRAPGGQTVRGAYISECNQINLTKSKSIGYVQRTHSSFICISIRLKSECPNA